MDTNIIPGENSIKMMSISDIEKLYPDSVPFIAKIDIEGFENELFSKNTGCIMNKGAYMITFDTTIFSRLLAYSLKSIVKSITYNGVVIEWE